MDKKLMILLITIVTALICTSPVIAAENNALFDYALFDLNIFGGDSDSNADNINVSDLKIEKYKREHTDSNGKTDKKTKYYLIFNVTGKGDSFGNYSISIQCFDKNNKSFKTVDSYVDKEGKFRIPLSDSSAVKSVNVTIKDKDGKVLYQGNTSKIKNTEKVTKDQPVEKKTESTSSSSSSSSSGQTYWASSNSNKFHYPGCEWAQKISGKNKVVFHSREDAVNSGYVPCQVCGP
jgi:hypothetical protein